MVEKKCIYLTNTEKELIWLSLQMRKSILSSGGERDKRQAREMQKLQKKFS